MLIVALSLMALDARLLFVYHPDGRSWRKRRRYTTDGRYLPDGSLKTEAYLQYIRTTVARTSLSSSDLISPSPSSHRTGSISMCNGARRGIITGHAVRLIQPLSNACILEGLKLLRRVSGWIDRLERVPQHALTTLHETQHSRPPPPQVSSSRRLKAARGTQLGIHPVGRHSESG